VLSYRPRAPRAHDPGGRNDRVWLLWPAWAFRVIAPEFRERRINVLQKAVLAILRASKLTAQEMGHRLGINPELAAYVVSELQGHSRVDAGWNVTKAGIELLDEEQMEAANMVPGWVFRDPWNGGLWPFVGSSLERARTERGDDGFPLLDLGTTGKPWRQRAWMQSPPENTEAQPPDAREILRAAIRQARLSRRAQRLEVGYDEGEQLDEAPRLDLDRVSSIEAEAEPVFLVTFLYVPKHGSESDLDWHACDFFGRGSNPTLRQLVTRVASENGHLAGALDRLMGRTIYGSFGELQRVVAERRHKAHSILDAVLTIDVHQHGVSEPLAEAIEAWLEVHDLGDAAAAWRLRGVLTACRRTLERLFRDIARLWSLSGISRRLSRDQVELNKAIVRGAAATTGLTEVPEALVKVSQGKVWWVAERGDGSSLRPLVTATVLRAAVEPRHPLCIAATRAPDLLTRIETVTVHAGEAAHDADDPQFDVATVDGCIELTVAVVGLLLGLPSRALNEVAHHG
jgi:hypothetical protein